MVLKLVLLLIVVLGLLDFYFYIKVNLVLFYIVKMVLK